MSEPGLCGRCRQPDSGEVGHDCLASLGNAVRVLQGAVAELSKLWEENEKLRASLHRQVSQ